MTLMCPNVLFLFHCWWRVTVTAEGILAGKGIRAENHHNQGFWISNTVTCSYAGDESEKPSVLHPRLQEWLCRSFMYIGWTHTLLKKGEKRNHQCSSFKTFHLLTLHHSHHYCRHPGKITEHTSSYKYLWFASDDSYFSSIFRSLLKS